METRRSLSKIWEIFKPFFIYYFLHSFSFLMLMTLCDVATRYIGGGARAYAAANAETVTGLVSGLSMVIGVLPLVAMLRAELRNTRAAAGDAAHDSSVGGRKTEGMGAREGEGGVTLRKALLLPLVMLLAAAASVGLNVLLSLTGLVQSSGTYREVARQQYSVLFGVGAVLFGTISPVVEEIVFRGIIFNRMRRHYPLTISVIASGVLFGIYHGNLVQGVYGALMGMLMAYVYARVHSFLAPCLFHATANVTVYAIARSAALSAQLFTLPMCAGLLLAAALFLFIIEKLAA